MKYDRKTRIWFRNEMSGKSAVAQIMDLVLTTFLAFFACYIWFLSRMQSQSLALVLAMLSAVVVFVLIWVIRSIRLDSFIQSYSAELRSKAILEQLLLESTESIRDMIEKSQSISGSHRIGKNMFVSGECLYGIIQRHPNEAYEASTLLDFYQVAQAHRCSQMRLYSTAPANTDACSLAEQISIDIVMHEPSELIAIAGYSDSLPEEDVIKKAMMQSIELRKAKQKHQHKRIFLPSNIRRYLYCAGIIMLASLITGYRIYYPMMAALCICMALLSWYFGKKTTKSDAEIDISDPSSTVN